MNNKKLALGLQLCVLKVRSQEQKKLFLAFLQAPSFEIRA
jgi:hypothetical protein